MKSKFFILWIIWSLLGAVLIYAVSSGDSKNTLMQIIAMVTSTAPFLGLLLAFGSPDAAQYFKNWLRNEKNSIYYTAGELCYCLQFRASLHLLSIHIQQQFLHLLFLLCLVH